MSRSSRIVWNGLFAASMVLTLGFGAVQAFASPVAAPEAGKAFYCDSLQCNSDCKRQGYDGGYCEYFYPSRATCVCE